MLPPEHRVELKRFHYDNGRSRSTGPSTAPIPWSHEDARRAGTVHVTEGLDELCEHAAELNTASCRPPFLLLGQYARYDPPRARPGKEVAWAYTHVAAAAAWARPHRGVRRPHGGAGRARRARLPRADPQAARLHAASLERADQNLVGGAVNGGTAQIHQQLVFRPAPGLGRPETPVDGLYLASASAHPGGGVHGACGANAAHAALAGSLIRRVSRLRTFR